MTWLRPPTFDIWFWLLVVWSLIVPYLFDGAHIDSCNATGQVTFVPVSSLWSNDNRTFECKPLLKGENI